MCANHSTTRANFDYNDFHRKMACCSPRRCEPIGTLRLFVFSYPDTYDRGVTLFAGLTGFAPARISINSRVLYCISFRPIFTPLHRLNGPAAIWEWGFPVISGLRGVEGIEHISLNYLCPAPTLCSNPSIKECYLQVTII